MRHPSVTVGSSPSPSLYLYGRHVSLCVVALSVLVIVSALLMTHFLPHRFQIHPLPYLSDAGLLDPERIVLSLGLAIVSTIFLPLVLILYFHHQILLRESSSSSSKPVLPASSLPRMGLFAGISTSVNLATFSAIPGFWFGHHVFTGFFAVSALSWVCVHVVFKEILGRMKAGDKGEKYKPCRRMRLLRALLGVQVAVVLLFLIIWICVQLRIPNTLIRNTDPRLLALALLEYMGISALLVAIAIVGKDLGDMKLKITISGTGFDKNDESAARRIGERHCGAQ